MSWLAGAGRRLRETLHRREEFEELDEEIRHHLETETRRLVEGGMGPEEAREEALRRFGPVSPVRERVREEAGFRWLEQTVRDVRIAARGLRRAPGFAAAAILTLGLGIGATTAIFSVVDAVLLEPLPYPESDRLVRVFQQNSPVNRWSLSVVDFQALQERERAFAAVAALRVGSAALTGAGRPERVSVGRVSAGWFRLFGIEPVEGRAFAPDEDRGDSPLTAVVSSAFRDRVFGAEGKALGESIVIDGRSHIVIGVLPPGRETIAGWTAEVWPILRLTAPGRRGPFFLRVFARLDSGATFERGRNDLERVSEEVFPLWSDGFNDRNAVLTPYALQGVVLGNVGGGLWLLMGAVVGVLLICVANVANLQLVRATGREREMTVRTSLGATSWRLCRQLLAESLLLSTLGGLLGLAIAAIGLRALVWNPSLPRVGEIGLDPGVLLFAALVSLASGVLFGLAPLAHALTRRLSAGLGSRGEGGARPAWDRLRTVLVTAEFAIALPILAGAGLMLSSLQRLQAVHPGYEVENLVSAQIALPTTAYATGLEVNAFWDEARRRIETIPGVDVAGVSTALPPDFTGGTNNFDLLDRPVQAGESEHVAVWSWTSPGFLEALDVPLLEGRMIEQTDGGESPPVLVVSRSWAERYYPGESALGAQLYGGGDRSTPMTVIGVVGDVKYGGLAGSDDAVVYEPYARASFTNANLLVRARGPVSDIVEGIRAEITALDPELPISNLEPMSDRMRAATATPRYWTTLLGLFALLGVTLAAIGVYGVLSYFVGRQQRTIGIRIALGAPPARVRRMVVSRGMTRSLIGVGVGLGVSFLVTRWLESLLFDVSATDPGTLVAAALVLIAVAFVACYVPARRATRIDPLATLRSE